MKKIMSALVLSLVMNAFYAYAKTDKTDSIVKKHPVEVKGMPDCGDCHTDKWKAFNHTAASFYDKHRIYAQDERLACAACHKTSFCSDCHAHKEDRKSVV